MATSPSLPQVCNRPSSKGWKNLTLLGNHRGPTGVYRGCLEELPRKPIGVYQGRTFATVQCRGHIQCDGYIKSRFARSLCEVCATPRVGVS